MNVAERCTILDLDIPNKGDFIVTLILCLGKNRVERRNLNTLNICSQEFINFLTGISDHKTSNYDNSDITNPELGENIIQESTGEVSGSENIYWGLGENIIQESTGEVSGSENIYWGLGENIIQESTGEVSGSENIYWGLDENIIQEPTGEAR